MKALLTGASSFSGIWFAEKLSVAGVEVVAPLARSLGEYDGIRAERVQRLEQFADVVPECKFGSESFFNLVRSYSFDVLCHHAARVGDYRSVDFDVTGAIAENTHNLRAVLTAMRERGLKAIVATGSVFEQDEGAGDEPIRAFSPYGVSKGLTWQILRYWCGHLEIPLSKFLIANPFGPWEDPRFCAYLIKTWRSGETATVRTPSYVRDNIHVDLMALAYAKFVTEAVDGRVASKFGPCGYVETQGAFAERFATAMQTRLGIRCDVKLLQQTDFAEPLIRMNVNVIDPAAYGWIETAAWNNLGTFYQARQN